MRSTSLFGRICATIFLLIHFIYFPCIIAIPLSSVVSRLIPIPAVETLAFLAPFGVMIALYILIHLRVSSRGMNYWNALVIVASRYGYLRGGPVDFVTVIVGLIYYLVPIIFLLQLCYIIPILLAVHIGSLWASFVSLFEGKAFARKTFYKLVYIAIYRNLQFPEDLTLEDLYLDDCE